LFFKGGRRSKHVLMVGHQSEASSISSNISMNFENCNTLLQAFKETHGEAYKLALLNN